MGNDKGNIVKLVANDGTQVEFFDKSFANGAMKDAYWTTDRKEVVLIFRNPIDPNTRSRLENIVGSYRNSIFGGEHGDYWNSIFCWPKKMVEWKGKTGVVLDRYPDKFFFSDGNFKGGEKNGKWFASAKLRNRFLRPEDKGTWLQTLQMLIKVARGVRRLHAAGLSHSDLSYNNVLLDPQTSSALIIDCDGLVVPGKYPPDVIGTPDFIAPEVVATQHLPAKDPQRKLPCRETDLHALAVMIYIYLLNRHPLRGGKVYSTDDQEDERLSMGGKALFIEHPTDSTNRVRPDQLGRSELPQGDPGKRPYTICGPYLTPLFDRAFIDGLHNPSARPTADEWEQALLKTVDLMQPCPNPGCEEKWYVFDNKLKPVCPFCGTPYSGELPVLNLYSSMGSGGKFMPENQRLMVYHHQSLYKWHVNRFISANEKTKPEDRRPVGDFHFHNGRWILINRALPEMREVSENKDIPIGGYVELTEGRQILLSKENGGRLLVVQLVKN